MFMLRNVSKYLFGDTSKETLIEIPQGQLYIVRPLSPKGYSELIFRDASASIRRTGQQHQYQLVINRFYEEGEAELAAEEDDTEGSTTTGLTGSEKDEKTFLLDQSLHFRSQLRQGGEIVLAWRDLSGDQGDLYEFICDSSTKPSDVESFHLAAVEAQYERKYRRDHSLATDDELKEFTFPEEQVIPSVNADESVEQSDNMVTKPVRPSSGASRGSPATAAATADTPTTAPVYRPPPQAKEVLVTETAELHLFDFPSGTFILQDPLVQARVTDLGNWNYWLQISNDKRDWLGRSIVDDINPVFNFEYLSFIFNYYTDDGSAYSWLLRFQRQEKEERFQQGFMQALWENVNKTKWLKTKDDERQYVLDAFQDLVMEDAEPAAAEEEEEEESENEDNDSREGSEHYDSDESQDDVETQPKERDANSQLAVGYKHDRSFVVRGNKIGVFKHTKDNHLKFDTTISGIQTPSGKLFSPKKVMLHAEDSDMVLQNPNNPNSLYRLDLETGKVVDEWKVHNDIPVETFAPSSKYSQMTNEQTLLGVSKNSLYRVDPRLAGNKLVDTDLKQYASNNEFSAAATTDKGYIAVASNKGDIRMFDRLGINAKTHLPALGEPIIGIDVSADGRWLLATTKNYLLLVDAMQKDGKNEGKLGFEKSFAKDSKPQPRRLALSPAHVAQMMHETRTPISFTTAHFNTGIDSNETTIITSTGPFIVNWSMKDILTGKKDPYKIKRYVENVKADNFKYGTDKNMIVALPNEVDMIKKSVLKRPTRESIAGPVRLSDGGAGQGSPLKTPSKGTRASQLRHQIVDSPY